VRPRRHRALKTLCARGARSGASGRPLNFTVRPPVLTPADSSNAGSGNSGAIRRRCLLVAVLTPAALLTTYIPLRAAVSLVTFFLLLAPVLVLLTLGLLIFVTIAITRLYWVSGAALMLGTVIAAVLLAYPSIPRAPASTAIQLVQFALYKYRLDAEVAAKRAAGVHPVLAVVTTDGFISMSNGFAYDSSGEILMPRERRSAAWEVMAHGTPLSTPGCWGAGRLFGNYYGWSSAC
jgi:hypothetical protein